MSDCLRMDLLEEKTTFPKLSNILTKEKVILEIKYVTNFRNIKM